MRRTGGRGKKTLWSEEGELKQKAAREDWMLEEVRRRKQTHMCADMLVPGRADSRGNSMT